MENQTSESISNLCTALSLVQSAIHNPKKDTENPFFKSKYADLAGCWDACRGPLTANGLSVTQLPSADGNRVTVLTILMHKTGEWIKSWLTINAKDATPQSIGSAISYARRYALCSVVGIAAEDDDGAAASGTVHAKEKTRPALPPHDVPDEPLPIRQDFTPAAAQLGNNQCRDRIIGVEGKTLQKKDGTGNYTTYSITTASNGVFSTFNRHLSDLANEAKVSGEDVVITFKVNGRYKNAEDLKLASASRRLVEAEVDSLPF